MHGEATDLSARLWDERAVLAQLVDDADRADVVPALFERLRALRLERDVLVHALAARWGAAQPDRRDALGHPDGTHLPGSALAAGGTEAPGSTDDADPDALAALAAVAPPPWDLLLPGHVAALDRLAAEVTAALPPGPLRDEWERLDVTPRRR
ncbi:hypothetical protein [Curtobacterium sp. MCBA15_004]|uniref:hypothetical protein n=1 Tax=unclassified Curtobacterium TaxID=257496 RepID=UPI0008DE4D26|nr:hypothetical protein [Curtobacterium sp. MCBA15_004]WIA96859.1 hypothetical protein QOL16_00275 [Curtobacterium sp. MCBA15_004]